MKKILFLPALAVLMLLAAPAFAHNDDDHTFSDLHVNHNNYPAIEYLVSMGTLQGYDDGTFKPMNTVNRAEIMKILVKGQGIDPNSSTYRNCFPDVGDEWFAPYVCYAQEKGWVNGYPDSTFKPANTVNKVEAVKMLVNALGLDMELPATVTETLFDDTDSAQWYAPYLKVAKDLNLLEVTSGHFSPTGGMNRAAISENIFRTLVSKGNDLTPYTETDRDAFLSEAELGDLVGTSATITEITVIGDEFSFSPSSLTLKSGENVKLTFKNMGNAPHNLTMRGLNLATATIGSGQETTLEFTASDAGTYSTYCSVSGHEAAGMKGSLVVQ